MSIIIQVAVILFSLSVHESAHAWAAEKFGDPTGRLQGRITLNPIPHIDIVGTILLPVILAVTGQPIFGWAKPVMVNPYNLRNHLKDGMFIAAAGPISNLITASAGIIIFLLFKSLLLRSMLFSFLVISLIFVNIILAIFNLIPVPPLDGSRILKGLLKGDALQSFQKIEPFGFIILIVILYAGVLDYIARPILNLVQGILF
ncbi:MAG: site-2 protease family protein [Candidatus Aminicenantes bacterium]|nr:site-2 protease family protein [Candidatus Aminicenantes bacterium]